VSDVGNGFPIAKAIHYIAVGIEFKVRGRLLRNFPFLVGHIIAINDEDVTLRVHGCEAPH
jgi:hypothetical protein